jgi:hypothetical protein
MPDSVVVDWYGVSNYAKGTGRQPSPGPSPRDMAAPKESR